jgi:malonyl CoA-acyl carrier protein transacylase
VQTLAGAGCTTYLELGSGRVLGGLVKQVLGMETDVSSVDSPAKLESFAERPELLST